MQLWISSSKKYNTRTSKIYFCGLVDLWRTTYLQISDLPFPLASILHECAENYESENLTTHKIVWKDLSYKNIERLYI